MVEQRGESQFGFEALLGAEYPRLLRLCTRLSGDADVAEDLAQQTLMEAWRHAHKLRDLHVTSPWLSAIARHVCRRWWRKQGVLAAHHVPLRNDEPGTRRMLGTWLTSDLDPEVEFERRDLVEFLHRAIGMLPLETRQILIARYVEDLPYTEIAERLGLREGLVKIRLHRGKRALRDLLAGEFLEEATTYGLVSPVATEWQATRIWCPHCGRQKVLGRLERTSDELAFTENVK